MSKPEGDQDLNRQQLKDKRNRLYKSFLKNPMRTQLAAQIKVLDDQLAEWAQQKRVESVERERYMPASQSAK